MTGAEETYLVRMCQQSQNEETASSTGRKSGVEEEEGSDSGSSVTSDIGSFLGFMEIE